MTHKRTITWVQCTKKNPCPQCGAMHFCTLSTDGIMSKCTKPQEGAIPIKQKDGTTAYLRRVSECAGGVALSGRTHRPRPAVPKLKTEELKQLNRQMQTALSPRRRAAASRELACRRTR